jgi:hypothetical protein
MHTDGFSISASSFLESCLDASVLWGVLEIVWNTLNEAIRLTEAGLDYVKSRYSYGATFSEGESKYAI